MSDLKQQRLDVARGGILLEGDLSGVTLNGESLEPHPSAAQSAPAGATAWAYHVTGKYRNEQGICTKESDINKTQALYLALGCHVEITPLYAAPQPAAQGEAVYQIQYLGDGGGGWCDVEKSEHDAYSAQQDYRTRTLYAHATAARQKQGDEVRRDAERYRWLNEQIEGLKSSNFEIVMSFLGFESEQDNGEFVKLSDAIDAALSAREE